MSIKGGEEVVSNSIIANNTKSIIKQLGIKQYVVAERAGYSNRTFSDMLNGRRIIKADEIPSIAKALGVTPNDLFVNHTKQIAI